MAMEILRYAKDSAIPFTAAAASAIGELCGVDSAGKTVLADADAPVLAVGVAVTAGVVGSRHAVALAGVVRNAAWTWTPGSTMYLSDTAGGWTDTPPATAADKIQPVGIAISATEIAFNVTPSGLALQAAGTSTVAFG